MKQSEDLHWKKKLSLLNIIFDMNLHCVVRIHFLLSSTLIDARFISCVKYVTSLTVKTNKVWTLTRASFLRSCSAWWPGSPLYWAPAWSRGGLGSESCPLQACTSAAMFRRRASPLKGWGQTGSPGEERDMAAGDSIGQRWCHQIHGITFSEQQCGLAMKEPARINTLEHHESVSVMN